MSGKVFHVNRRGRWAQAVFSGRGGCVVTQRQPGPDLEAFPLDIPAPETCGSLPRRPASLGNRQSSNLSSTVTECRAFCLPGSEQVVSSFRHKSELQVQKTPRWKIKHLMF